MVTDLDGGPGSNDDGIVNPTVHDEKNVMTRKMLAIEQFRDERDKALANAHFLTGLTEIFTPVFAGMIDRGLIKRDDTGMLAFAYTTPISWLIHQCDRSRSMRRRPSPGSRRSVGISSQYMERDKYEQQPNA